LLDETRLEDAVTTRTKAVVPVHYAGQACGMAPIIEIARRHGIAVVEDAAHAFPASYRGETVGSLGDAAAFSFYATKTLAAGEGGMLATDNHAVARRARIMRLHGITHGGEYRDKREGTWDYNIETAGFKYNMPELQAAIGLVQLRRREELLKRRSAIAQRYLNGFSSIEQIELPPVLPEREHAWHLFVIRLRTETLSIDRAEFIRELRERNIGASVHFIPLHLHPYYAELTGHKPGDFPDAEAAFERIISLPIWPGMCEADVDRVIEAVRDVAEANSKAGRK